MHLVRLFLVRLWKSVLGLELTLVRWFSEACQSPHWSFFWIVYALGWIVLRQIIHPGWYTDTIDFLVVAFSFSVVPFWVENSVKTSQVLQMQKQLDQIQLLEEGQEVIAHLIKVNVELAQKILIAMDPNNTISTVIAVENKDIKT